MIMNGDALGEMLMNQQANCTVCGTAIKFESGVGLARKFGITDNVVMCPKCKSVFTVHIVPGRMTLTEDVSSKYEENIQRAKQESSGCYVATACYGSYDCTQVLTFRQYRDEFLSQTLAGRMFIKTYYALSPSFAKWLENKHRINAFIRENFLELIYKFLKDKY